MTESGNKKRIAPEGRLSRAQLLRMLGISERQLRVWEKQGWVMPQLSEERPKTAGYSFSEVATLRALLRLRRSGITASRLRLIHAALRERLQQAGIASPWNAMQIHNQGKRLSVYFQGCRMEPLTGQLLLDYRDQGAKQAALRTLVRRRKSSMADRDLQANRLFLAGLRYEGSPDTLPKAIRAYQRALELNPQALGASINLGTIYYRQGLWKEAETCYRAALAVNPAHALVHFNLANLFEETGKLAKAREHYEEAVRLDPNYADPRYNLALVYERLGLHGKAFQQWRAYLKLDSRGPWAEYARSRLEAVPLRVLPSRKSLPDA
jgi:tetratricopeptide (TPR) repeat protein